MSSDSINNVGISGALRDLHNLNIGSNESNNNEQEEDFDICAACGKEGDGDNMNTCNKCDLVKYCNAACKKKHRSKHKKKCERRVAELYDQELFKEPPLPEDCPICFLPLPTNTVCFYPCCGKNICGGCMLAMIKKTKKDICPFCRTPYLVDVEEHLKQLNKQLEKSNADAFNHFAGFYAEGTMGLPQNWEKANELYLKAGQLGCAVGYKNLGDSYAEGNGVEVDKKKAMHYLELAAMNGCEYARHNLGIREAENGNIQRAMKHCAIAAKAGDNNALDDVKYGYTAGYVTKDEYAQALRGYQKWQDEVRSDARDKAKAAAIRCMRDV